MSALPEKRPLDNVFTPFGMLQTLQELRQSIDAPPTDAAIQGISDSFLEQLNQRLGTIEDRKKLAQEVVVYLKQKMPGIGEGGDEALQQKVMKELEGLQVMLSMEAGELKQKLERMAAIEASREMKQDLKESTGILQNGWNTVKKHKWKIIFALAAIAAGVAVWYYWDYLALLFRGGVGAGAAGATGLSQPEAVGKAVQLGLEQIAANTETIAIVEHDIFLKGVAYNVKNATDMTNLSARIGEMVAQNPNIQFTQMLSETSRASAEAALDGIIKQLPKPSPGSGWLLTPRATLESLGTALPEATK